MNRTRPAPAPTDDSFLSPREWLISLGCAVVIVAALPWLWRHCWPLEIEPDHRVPYALSADYWHFERHSEHAAANAEILLLGDSVVWGAYARSDQTLSHYLSLRDGRRCADLGFNGAHPAALCGAVEQHGDAIRQKVVILHCNLLWMSSPRHDLSDDKEHMFNHPELVRQFDPDIRVYRADASTRIGRMLGQWSEFSTFKRHLQQAHFGQRDIPSWTIDNPYRLIPEPAAAPTADDEPAEQPGSWTERGLAAQDFAWLTLSDSVQWRYFRSLTETLRARGNRLIVLVGPFNEHMLTPAGRRGHAALRAQVLSWLTGHGIDSLAPEVLPSELYADASHPLAAGYRLLAERIELGR